MERHHNSYEFFELRLQIIQTQTAQVRRVHQGKKNKWCATSSKYLIAVYIFILSTNCEE